MSLSSFFLVKCNRHREWAVPGGVRCRRCAGPVV